MAPRILALVSDCYGVRGGIARYNQDLFEALAEEGTEVSVLPRYGEVGDAVLPNGVRQFQPVRGRVSYALTALWTVWKNRPFDVIFCGHAFMAPLAWVVAWAIGARYWMQAHGTEIWTGRRTLVRRAIEGADLVTTVSRATRQSLLGWANVAPERARVLPDTVRDIFKPGPRDRALAERLGLGPGPLLLTVARLSASERYKGHEPVFSVLTQLRARFPDLVHVVVGDGDDRERLERRARELTQDSGAVRFLGFVADEDLPGLYRLSDLYVMPSTQEGFGIAYLEAAACGLRVVGGLGGGSVDAIPDGRIGELVDPADGARLAQTIERLLGQGPADQAAVEPYRQRHFAVAARRLLARLMGQGCRMTSRT